jgi:hypothetical protein
MTLQATLLDEIISMATALKGATVDTKFLLRATQALVAASGKKTKAPEPSTDHLSTFFEKCLLVGTGYQMPKADLRQRYEGWCLATSNTPVIPKVLSTYLRTYAADGSMKVNKKSCTSWVGLCLQPFKIVEEKKSEEPLDLSKCPAYTSEFAPESNLSLDGGSGQV